MLIEPDRIEAAHRGIDRAFKNTLHFESESLGALTGSTVLVKDETRNSIGSYKGRGTSWWTACHPDVKKVVTASAGNFGQGIAHACGRADREVHIFASENANPAKLEAMRDLGAEVYLEGKDFDEAKDAARAFARSNRMQFVEDGREIEIAEGAGTIGLELARSRGAIDKVYLPVGNGALANGVGSYFKARRPAAEIVGVCAKGAPSMARSWKRGLVVETERADTIADGIAVRVPVPESLPILIEAVDSTDLVSDAQIKAAMQLLFKFEGIVSEPAGAVSLAGALKQSAQDRGKRVVTIVTGSNIDPTLQSQWLGD